jgi:hypothetical protein
LSPGNVTTRKPFDNCSDNFASSSVASAGSNRSRKFVILINNSRDCRCDGAIMITRLPGFYKHVCNASAAITVDYDLPTHVQNNLRAHAHNANPALPLLPSRANPNLLLLNP